jgi:hypothetical protein
MEASMVRRLLTTVGCLLFAAGAFVFGGPVEPGPLNPFGILFLFLAVVAWRGWGVITGDFSPALWDGFAQGLRGGTDDHHREP